MTTNGQPVMGVRCSPASRYVPAGLLAELWAALHRAEGAGQMAWEAARLSTAAALANEQAAVNLRRVLADCGALPPEQGAA